MNALQHRSTFMNVAVMTFTETSTWLQCSCRPTSCKQISVYLHHAFLFGGDGLLADSVWRKPRETPSFGHIDMLTCDCVHFSHLFVSAILLEFNIFLHTYCTTGALSAFMFWVTPLITDGAALDALYFLWWYRHNSPGESIRFLGDPIPWARWDQHIGLFSW